MLNKIVFAAAVLCAGAQALPDAKPTSCAAVSCLVGSTCKVHPVHGARCVKNDIVGCDQLRCAVCEETFDGTGVCKPVDGIVPPPVPISCAAVSCIVGSTCKIHPVHGARCVNNDVVGCDQLRCAVCEETFDGTGVCKPVGGIDAIVPPPVPTSCAAVSCIKGSTCKVHPVHGARCVKNNVVGCDRLRCAACEETFDGTGVCTPVDGIDAIVPVPVPTSCAAVSCIVGSTCKVHPVHGARCVKNDVVGCDQLRCAVCEETFDGTGVCKPVDGIIPPPVPTSCAAVSCLVGSTCKVHPVHGARCVKNDVVGCDQLRCAVCEETFDGTGVCKPVGGIDAIVPPPVPTSCAAVSCIVGSTCKVHPVHGARCVKNDVVGCDRLRCAVCEESFDGTGVCKPVDEIVPAPVPTSCAAVSCLVGSTCKVHPVHGARCVKNDVVGCDQLRCAVCEETFDGTGVCKPVDGIVPAPVPTSCAAVSCYQDSTCKIHPVHGARCVKNDVVGCDQLRCAVCEETFDGTGVCKPVDGIVPAPVPTSCAAVSCYQDSTCKVHPVHGARCVKNGVVGCDQLRCAVCEETFDGTGVCKPVDGIEPAPVPTSCAAVSCPTGFTCEIDAVLGARCVEAKTDACAAVTCPVETRCFAVGDVGLCLPSWVHPRGCAALQCRAGFECREVLGWGYCRRA